MDQPAESLSKHRKNHLLSAVVGTFLIVSLALMLVPILLLWIMTSY